MNVIKMNQRAANLILDQPWSPNAADFLRGRAAMRKVFNSPCNLTVPIFAKRSRKSIDLVMRNVRAKHYLALDFGGRGLRLPDFQLDNVVQRLVSDLLKNAGAVDTWTLYHLLVQKNEALNGKSAVKSVRRKTIKKTLSVLLSQLGLYE